MMRFVRSATALLVVASLSGCSKDAPSTEPPEPGASAGAGGAAESSAGGLNPFVLSCAVNLDGRETLRRGWPAVLRVSAAFDHEPEADERYTLDNDALRLTVRDASDKEQPLSFTRAVASETVLDADHPALELIRVLSGERTDELTKGTYTLEVSWGPARERFEIAVEDPPPDSPRTNESRALLEADAALQLGHLDAALDGLDLALDDQPDSIVLLNQRAIVREQAGDDEGALVDAQAALAAFYAQFPDASEPPITILQVNGRVLNRLLGGAP
ncbi:MAG TPA: hypothetical protein VEQ59_21150 [Polyangiaceae bacterium]|nr:hypothetical protein [Polyangiaceae bacterium]